MFMTIQSVDLFVFLMFVGICYNVKCILCCSEIESTRIRLIRMYTLFNVI